MSDEIKEILDRFDRVLKNYEIDKKIGNLSVDSIYHLFPNEMIAIKDYITNLQEEVENLREEDWAWHQLLRMQNKREYRSKFLKDFQKEYGTNVYPDYDEIYKRYDKMKLRINRAIECIDNREWADCEECVNQVYNILRGEDNEETDL